MKREHVYKIFSKMPRLETERCILRKISIDDTNDMFEYSQRTDVTEFLTWSPHRNKAYTLEYLTYIQSRYKTGDFFDWAVIYKETGKMIGTCGFTRFDFLHDGGEIGYVINPDYAGQGIATEVVGRVIRFGFENLSLNRIECKYIIGNEASRRVMDKNGMIFEGVRRKGMCIKGIYRDIGICSILSEEFFSEKDK